ncbi:MAG: PIN domain-containing protein [Candidatus Lokiarchaeota archaeon]|nr:PIN domain-containing protein [Candidatus Lokiarchaeota archaeon]
MKNTIFVDTGVISLYASKNKNIIQEIKSKKKKDFFFITSELNYVELFNHLCRKQGKINAQVIMENLRKGNIITFIPVSNKISILAGELKCRYQFLSMVDAVIIAEAMSRKIYLYTTETHFNDVENLKVKKVSF